MECVNGLLMESIGSREGRFMTIYIRIDVQLA